MADKIKCEKCGLPLMGKWPTDENGNGPCENGADSPRYCETLANRWFSANDQSLVEAGLVKPEAKTDTIAKTTAMLDAAGIGQETRDYWLAQVQARRDAEHELRMIFAANGETPTWLDGLHEWLHSGPNDVRLLALLRELIPTPNGSESYNFGEIVEWHENLARRAAEILGAVDGYGE